ncbi:MAG TPA: Tol-Pal system beta propeller repeat protein TolB [Nitrospirales bacterium]|nr:Tol-Pal system beta propeller repeat protein TolB [Nitrospirales bacterium]
MRTFLFIFVLIAGLSAALMQSRAADVFMEATRPDFQKIPIGVLGFQDLTKLDHAADKIAEVLRADLKRSQIFTVADLPKLGIKMNGALAATDNDAKVLMKKAADQGISVLVWGKLGLRDADLALDGIVSDSGEVVADKRYIGQPAVSRLIAHRMADELVYRYTGEAGIARTKIAFVSEQGGSRELYVMDYDGYAPRQVTADGFLNLMPRWSRDRKYLIFTSYRSRSKQNIEMIELASGQRWTLVSLNGLNITPALSPDGSWLAFATSHDGNSEIYKLDTNTKELHRLTFHSSGDLSPAWSPTGRDLAFVSDRGGGPQVYVMNADGSNVRRLTFEGDYNAAPAWSPRGNWIAYVCRTAERQYKLCLITPDGQKRVQLTSGGGVDDSPSWSPDGRHLVFSSTSEGKSHIYLINVDGTDLERLTSGGAHHTSPSWSPA